MAFENEAVRVGVPGADRIACIARDASPEHEGCIRVSVDEFLQFPLRLVCRELEHGAALEAEAAAVAQISPEETELVH
ncbi:MAG: hypothetical protein BWX71_01531 [Deltaproteobacteria bacterium ADurb.Bin072]|nr:MAG: hypothetical protein BWX71_01531 [Deltaproteobacteria bacterium ADurb.Bin072]